MTTEPQRPANRMFDRAREEAAQEAQGRFARQSQPSIAGTSAIVLSAPAWSHDPVGTEPPIGELIDALPSMETYSGIETEALALDRAAGTIPEGGEADAE
jgi:hypothetical protein